MLPGGNLRTCMTSCTTRQMGADRARNTSRCSPICISPLTGGETRSRRNCYEGMPSLEGDFSMQSAALEPLFDIDPRTGTSIEVFFADRALETFGRCGAGWFWWCRRRGYPPEGSAAGPFPTSYAAYRHAMNPEARIIQR